MCCNVLQRSLLRRKDFARLKRGMGSSCGLGGIGSIGSIAEWVSWGNESVEREGLTEAYGERIAAI